MLCDNIKQIIEPFKKLLNYILDIYFIEVDELLLSLNEYSFIIPLNKDKLIAHLRKLSKKFNKLKESKKLKNISAVNKNTDTNIIVSDISTEYSED